MPRPGLLPGAGAPGPAQAPPARTLPHGTTIVALDFDGGVIMAGDRRSTAGNMIAQRDIEKVFRSDDFSCVGISGVAGIGLELVRLFQLELEHYEKLEGRTLSLEGKANRLATFVRGNLGGAMQGLVVVPLFAGFDEDTGKGRIFSYDVAGGRYEERRFHSDRLRLGVRARLAEEALHRRHGRGRRDHGVHAGALRRRRRRLRHRWPRPDPADLPGGGVVTADGFRRLTDDEAGEYSQRSRRRAHAVARRPGRATCASPTGTYPCGPR